MTPDSGLAMTEAASLNVIRFTTVAPVFCIAAGFGLLASDGGAVLPRVDAEADAVEPVPVVLWETVCSRVVSVDPSGKTLSVSCSRSFKFFSRDSQNRFLDLFSICIRETLPPPDALDELDVAVSALVDIWVLVETVPVTSRDMLT